MATILFRQRTLNTGVFSQVVRSFASSSQTRNKAIITMDKEYSQRMQRVLEKHLKGCNPYRNLEPFIKKAFLASHTLPKIIRSSVYDFKTSGNQSGYLLIRSLPVEENLMDTPKNLSKVPNEKTSHYSEFWLSSIGSLLGEPFSYIQENNGNLFHNVRPQAGKEEKISSESSDILLDLHSETAFHPFYPDYLLLFCLRGDRNKQAKTIVSCIEDCKHEIKPELEAILRQPLFKTGIDYSFGSQNGTKGNGPIMPILYGAKEDPIMVFDPDLMVGITEEASQAIIELKMIMDRHKKGVLLEPGDLLIVDNHRAVHGRNQFKAYYDGKDRWLQRVYISRNLLQANKAINKSERIISYTFNTQDPGSSQVMNAVNRMLNDQNLNNSR